MKQQFITTPQSTVQSQADMSLPPTYEELYGATKQVMLPPQNNNTQHNFATSTSSVKPAAFEFNRHHTTHTQRGSNKAMVANMTTNADHQQMVSLIPLDPYQAQQAPFFQYSSQVNPPTASNNRSAVHPYSMSVPIVQLTGMPISGAVAGQAATSGTVAAVASAASTHDHTKERKKPPVGNKRSKDPSERWSVPVAGSGESDEEGEKPRFLGRIKSKGSRWGVLSIIPLEGDDEEHTQTKARLDTFASDSGIEGGVAIGDELLFHVRDAKAGRTIPRRGAVLNFTPLRNTKDGLHLLRAVSWAFDPTNTAKVPWPATTKPTGTPQTEAAPPDVDAHVGNKDGGARGSPTNAPSSTASSLPPSYESVA